MILFKKDNRILKQDNFTFPTEMNQKCKPKYFIKTFTQSFSSLVNLLTARERINACGPGRAISIEFLSSFKIVASSFSVSARPNEFCL